MVEPNQSSPTLHRWPAFFLALGFCIWRVADRDYWGAAFGGVCLLYLVVKPTSPDDLKSWRRPAVRGVSIGFFVLALAAIWQTLSQ